MTFTDAMRRAYDDSGDAWNEGPARVYRALAEPVLDAAGDVVGADALDVGTGSGVLADGLVSRGARVTGLDLSHGMLRRGADVRPPAVVGDVRALPIRARSLDLVTASFVLNHLEDPVAGVEELARVLRVGGRLLATTFEGEAAHPAKGLVDEVARSFGYSPPSWYVTVKTGVQPLLASATAFAQAASEGGLVEVGVDHVPVTVALAPGELAGWRFGMAHLAPFVAQLDDHQRTAMIAEAEGRLAGVTEPLELGVLLLSGRVA